MATTKRTIPAFVAAGMIAGIAATATFYEAATDTETTVTPTLPTVAAEAVELPVEAAAPIEAALGEVAEVTCSRPAHDPATPAMAGRLFCTGGDGLGFYVEQGADDAATSAAGGEVARLVRREGKVYAEGAR